MASLISAATGNFTTASTWKTVQAQGEIDSQAGTVVISTSNIDSPTFTPTNTAHDGVALKLAARAASPSGTFTVTLRNSTTSTDAASVTVNVSDLPSSGLGWVFFKFGSNVTPNGTDSYIVRCVCSTTGSQVTLYRSTSGTNNISKKLRTTTTAAPGANDHLVIVGEKTGAGTGNNLTVTLDNTATTTFGPSTVGDQAIYVCNGGTFACGTATSTNYYFRWRGIFTAAGGGVVNFGTSGTRIPASSTLTLEYDCAANTDSKLRADAGGSVNIYGAEKTTWTKLTADAASSATSFTVGDTTGWRSGDTVAFSPTTSGTMATVGGHHQALTVDAVSSSTAFTTTAGLSQAKSGTAPVQSFVLNLTRNVIFTNVSSSNRGNIYVPPAGGDMHLEYCVVSIGGANSTTNRTVDIQATTNTAYFKGLCLNGANTGNALTVFNVSGASVNNFTIDSCVVYNFQGTHFAVSSATSGTSWTINNCVGLRNVDAGPIFNIGDCGGTFTNNKAILCTAYNNGGAITFSESSSFSNLNFDYNEGWYSNAAGILVSATGTNETVTLEGTGCVLGRNNLVTNGGGFATTSVRTLTLNNWEFVGNAGTNIGGWGILNTVQRAVLNGCTFSGDTSFGQAAGITVRAAVAANIELNSCSFGVASGLRVAHTTGDINFESSSGTAGQLRVTASNCVFASSTVISNLATDSQRLVGDHINGGSQFRSQKHGQTAGDHRTYLPQGVIKTDTTIYNTASPSERLTPNSSTYKLRSSPCFRAIDSGTSATMRVWVRKSATGDGADYNGSQPRLMLRRVDALGVTSTQVLDTMTASNGTWEQLEGATPTATDDGVYTVYVDCDGTAGWINVDDWS